MGIKGSLTEKNLIAAFAGESQARNRYTYYASLAKKEGYEQISAIFLETADNEKEHAKVFFKLLEEGEAVVNASYPVSLGNTLANLKAAAEGEKMEWSALYPDFARVAGEEGFEEIKKAFLMIARVEVEHEKRYNKLLENIASDMVFRKNIETSWKCRNCGYVQSSASAPDKCPACSHPKGYFEIRGENY